MSYVRILLVEDNPADAQLLQEYLPRNMPFELDLFHCRTLERALRELERSSQTHLILTDLWMSDSRGIATVAKLRAAAPELPIIVLSGWEDPEQVQQAIAAGANDYLNKANLNGLAFARTLTELLKRRLVEIGQAG